MKFTLYRYMNGIDYCMGILSYEGGEIGDVIEPRYDKRMSLVSGALPEGTYDMEVTINPSAGVPCIKLTSEEYNISAKIRCYHPLGKSNRSPFLAFVDSKGRVSDEPNVKGWIELIGMLKETKDAKLFIKGPTPSLPQRRGLLDRR